jgi:hypothetical protein
MTAKSERLKKLEAELNDLTQWLKLGLVPKRDIPKHQSEIDAITVRIEEEKHRLQILKENGDIEEFVVPRRNNAKNVYSDAPTMGDLDVTGDIDDYNESSSDFDRDSMTLSSTVGEGTEEEGNANSTIYYGKDDETESASPKRKKKKNEDTADEDPFSDRNRWRRGMLEAEVDEW